jgi:hypothetical protein
MAKAPKPGAKRKAEEIDDAEAWTITLSVFEDGEEPTKYALRLPDVTARDVLALRTFTPFRSWQDMIAPLIRGESDPVSCAALVWLVRRRDDEGLDFGDVLDDLTLDKLNSLSTHTRSAEGDAAEEPGEDDSPEA